MQTVINIKRPHSQLGNSWLLSGICPTQLRERRNHPCLLVVADTLLVRRSLVTGQSGHSKISMTAHNGWQGCVNIEQLLWTQYQVFMYTLDSTFVQFQLWIFYRLEKGKYKLAATQKWAQKGISRLIWNCFFF